MGFFLRARSGQYRKIIVASGALIALAPLSAHAIAPDQIDTFEGINTMGWGGAPPILVTTGGPAGADDGFMRITATGGGPGGKITTHNRSRWIGNYIAAGVTSIEMDLINFGEDPLSIRVAYKQGTSSFSGGYSALNPFILPGDGAWHHAVFSLDSSALTPVGSIAITSNQLLMNPAEMRILHSVQPDVHGDDIFGSIGVDNIRAIAAPQAPQWKLDGSGSWGEPSNWTGGIPNAVGAEANFLGGLKTVANAPAIVLLDGDRTVGALSFDNTVQAEGFPYSYVIDGSNGGTLTINNGDDAGLMSVVSGSHLITAPLAVAGDTELSVAASSSLDITSETTVAGGKTLTKTGPGSAPISRLVGGRLNVQDGKVRVMRSAGVSVIEDLSTGATGQFDIDDAGLVLTAGDLDSVRNMLIAGRNAPTGGVSNGKWDGVSGIVSAAAAAAAVDGEDLSVGYALNSDLPLGQLTEFMGQPVSPSDILVRMTRNGDANLDGVVNNNDITVLAGNYRPGEMGKHWYEADFNYDGQVNNNDITILAGFYRPNDPPLGAGALAAVPEPAATTLLILASVLPTFRRRRR